MLLKSLQYAVMNKAVTTIPKIDTPHYHGHRQRVRERFLKSQGKDMPDYELLEMLLFSSNPRGDVKPLAKRLINEFGSFANVISAPVEKLNAIKGLGESGVAAIKLVQESALRLLHVDIEERPILQSWKALLDYCRASMGYNKKEQFRIFFLDKKNKLIADELQQEGTVDHTPVYPREVVKRALELGSSALILVHNHPSGDPSPSQADITMTQQIIQASATVNVMVHDHLIIAGKDHFSFAAHGLL